jgi:hypothetical protein
MPATKYRRVKQDDSLAALAKTVSSACSQPWILSGIALTKRLISGKQDPQFVPQRVAACSCAIRSLGLPAQSDSTSVITLFVTLKQAHT